MALSVLEEVHKFEDSRVELPYRFVSLNGVGTETVRKSLLYFNGYAESDRSTEAVLRNCALDTDLAPTALKIDFSKLRDKGAFGSKIAAVERIGRELVPSAMHAFYTENDEVASPAVGHSMGSLMLGMGLDETNGEYISDTLSVNGMGFTVDHETGRAHSNRASFLAHYALALATGASPKNEELYWSATASAIKAISRDMFLSRTFPSQLALANTTDVLPAYIEHAMRGNIIIIMSGNKDKLFSHNTVAINIAANNTAPTLSFEAIEDLPHQDAGLNKTISTIANAVKKHLQ